MEEHEFTTKDGETITVVPKSALEGVQSELETIKGQLTEKDTAVENLTKEIAETKRLLAEKNQNFTKYNEMSEEQKKKFNETETTLLRRLDELETELTATKSQLTEKEKKELGNAKANLLKGYHHGKPEIEAEINKHYDSLSGMPETTDAEIAARGRAAAQLAGINVNETPNPIYTQMTGEAPQSKQNKEYVETPAGQQAADMLRESLGIKKPNYHHICHSLKI